MGLEHQRCVVVDHGQFLNVALRLARDLAKVYYVCPQWEQAAVKIDDAVIGDGYESIERVDEVWDVLDKVDFAVFPDTGHSGMQQAIVARAIPVWGSRDGDKLELWRSEFKKLAAEAGIAQPKHVVVKGVEGLRDHAMDPSNVGRWIKMTPQFRGLCETFKIGPWASVQPLIDEMGAKLGRLGDHLVFLSEEHIESEAESGIDTYVVDGRMPDLCLIGYEAKDRAYAGFMAPRGSLPECLRETSEPIAATLASYGTRQMLSTEVRVDKDGRGWLLEPTIRFPFPPGGVECEIYENFSEIISEGARGILVQPVVKAAYGCEMLLAHEDSEDKWRWSEVPQSLERWLKLASSVRLGRETGIAPGSDKVGSLVSLGRTFAEAVSRMRSMGEELPGTGLVPDYEGLEKAVEASENGARLGIKFQEGQS